MNPTRVLLDENFPPSFAEMLVAFGVDAVPARDRDLLGQGDDDVIAVALAEERIVVTHDQDFPDWLRRHNASAPSVVHVRLRAPFDWSAIARQFASIFALYRSELARGALITVKAKKVRVNPLPLNPAPNDPPL